MKVLAGALVVLAGVFRWVQFNSLDLAGGLPIMNIGIEQSFNSSSIGNLAGKSFLVTGTTKGGLGAFVVKHLFENEAKVFLTCRKEEKCLDTIEQVKKQVAGGDSALLVPVVMKLSSIKDVRKAWNKIGPEIEKTGLDGLILNAGYLPNEFRLTNEGLEESFVVNHLAGFQLFKLAQQALEKVKGTVVTVSSNVHSYPWQTTDAGVPLTKEEINDPKNFESSDTYGMGKLLNVLMVKELDKRYFDSTGIIATASHPGGVNTNFLSRLFEGDKSLTSSKEFFFRLLHKIETLVFWDAETASLTIVAAAVSPIGHGEFTVPIARPMIPSAKARNQEVAEKVWNLSEDLLKEIN